MSRSTFYLHYETMNDLLAESPDYMHARFSVSERDRHYRMKFYLSSIAAIVEEWLREDCADSVERIMAVILHCVERR